MWVYINVLNVAENFCRVQNSDGFGNRRW